MATTFAAKSVLGELLTSHRDEIYLLAAEHHARNVRVFGSVSRGEDRTDSDIDLLVDFDDESHPLDILALGCALEELLGRRVDLCSVSGLRPSARDEILNQAIAL